MRKKTATFWKLGSTWMTRLIINWFKRCEKAVSSAGRVRAEKQTYFLSRTPQKVQHRLRPLRVWEGRGAMERIWSKTIWGSTNHLPTPRRNQRCVCSLEPPVDTRLNQRKRQSTEHRERCDHSHPQCWDPQPSSLLGFHRCGRQA